jgi:hypothetical protein
MDYNMKLYFLLRLSYARVKNVWSHTSHLPYLFVSQFLVRYKDNIVFYLFYFKEGRMYFM